MFVQTGGPNTDGYFFQGYIFTNFVRIFSIWYKAHRVVCVVFIVSTRIIFSSSVTIYVDNLCAINVEWSAEVNGSSFYGQELMAVVCPINDRKSDGY